MDLENVEIKGISCDSRKTNPGDVFVAIPGLKMNGCDFIPEAIKKGALTIVSEKDFKAPCNIKKIIVPNARKALAELSCRYYDHPSKKLKLIGITGTNGKTTIAYLVESIFRKAGYKTGLIGTVETKIAGKSLESHLTTPESLELQGLLAQMVKEGVTHVVMEVSSHSLAQYRVYGCEFDAAIYTNLTHDHLDFHKTMEQYLGEKKKLFQMLKPHGIAIINVDDKHSNDIASVVETEVMFYGIKQAKHELKSAKHGEFDLSLKEILMDSIDEMRMKIDSTEIRTQLFGYFNAYNILAAYQCGLTFNLNREIIKKGIESVYVPGRLEKIDCGQDFKVFVDFAHSPDALEKLLETLKPFVKGKLIVVFGCPGDRDREKRPIMGKIASELADVVIVTTDDPHSEDPNQIISEILSGASNPSPCPSDIPLPQGEGMRVTHYVDRKEAIEKALSIAQKGDIVVIAGRGHEKHQDFNGKRVPLDDREVVKAYLK